METSTCRQGIESRRRRGEGEGRFRRRFRVSGVALLLLSALLVVAPETLPAGTKPAASRTPKRSAAAPEVVRGRVKAVNDGDTFVLQTSTGERRIRVAGIDCPELRQPWGAEARRFAAAQVEDRKVEVRVRTVDRYDRWVAEVILPDGRSLGEELVREGLAWWYRAYSRSKRLRVLEEEARRARRGLWSEPDPIPPWTWRQRRHLGP